jgi:hypothetical protein
LEETEQQHSKRKKTKQKAGLPGYHIKQTNRNPKPMDAPSLKAADDRSHRGGASNASPRSLESAIKQIKIRVTIKEVRETPGTELLHPARPKHLIK